MIPCHECDTNVTLDIKGIFVLDRNRVWEAIVWTEYVSTVFACTGVDVVHAVIIGKINFGNFFVFVVIF